jgi:hypothetical protein
MLPTLISDDESTIMHIMIQRATLAAQAEDLGILKEEARRRGVSLSSLLAEIVAREAGEIRSARRPRLGVISRPVSIAEEMEHDPDGPIRGEFRSA